MHFSTSHYSSTLTVASRCLSSANLLFIRTIGIFLYPFINRFIVFVLLIYVYQYYQSWLYGNVFKNANDW